MWAGNIMHRVYLDMFFFVRPHSYVAALGNLGFGGVLDDLVDTVAHTACLWLCAEIIFQRFFFFRSIHLEKNNRSKQM